MGDFHGFSINICWGYYVSYKSNGNIFRTICFFLSTSSLTREFHVQSSIAMTQKWWLLVGGWDSSFRFQFQRICRNSCNKLFWRRQKKEAAATADFVKNLHTDWWGEADLPSGWDVWAFIRKFYARKARDCHAQGGKDGLALVDGRQLVTISEKVGPSKLPPRNHGNGKFPFHLHMGHCP